MNAICVQLAFLMSSFFAFRDLTHRQNLQAAALHTQHPYSCVLSRPKLHLPSTSAASLIKHQFSTGVKAHHTCSMVKSISSCRKSFSALSLHVFFDFLLCWHIAQRDYLPFYLGYIFSSNSMQGWILSFPGKWLHLMNTVLRPF